MEGSYHRWELSQVEGSYDAQLSQVRGAISGGGELELDWSLSDQRWREVITDIGERSGLEGSYHR